MRPEELFSAVVMSALAAGVLIIVLALRYRARSMEMLHRERLAMIERGLVPPPEVNPAHVAWRGEAPRPGDRGSARALTAGIVIIALGFAFMTLIGVAANTPDVAVGLGGAIAIIGVSLVVISLVRRHLSPAAPPAPAPVAPSPEPKPPARID